MKAVFRKLLGYFVLSKPYDQSNYDEQQKMTSHITVNLRQCQIRNPIRFFAVPRVREVMYLES